jgi:amidase
VGSRELLEHFLARIDRLNSKINAVVTLDVERARHAADAADAARARGTLLGPLHGLPMTVKDTFETAGLRTTAGAPELAQHVPAADAVAVARLRAAGAVILGKTNTPIYAGDAQTYNAVFGTTNNPWDVRRTPGGSSGGSAAALAAGLTGLELGSDIGGSIRHPSNWCGTYGHKPSHGLVPQRGHIPGPPGTLAEIDLATVGPMGRAADDLVLGLDVLAGPDADRAVAWRLSLPPPRRLALRDFRVAAWLDDPAIPVESEVRDRLEGAVAALRAAGVTVDERARPALSLADAFRDYLRLLSPLMVAGLPPVQWEGIVAHADQLDPAAQGYDDKFARFATARHRDWLQANEARAGYRARWEEFFRDHDVLLCPVDPVTAFAHDDTQPIGRRTIVSAEGATRPYLDVLGWVGAIGNLCWLPATVAPVGQTPAGLPVGIQIVGPYLEDRTPIEFARRMVDVTGGFTPPPGF